MVSQQGYGEDHDSGWSYGLHHVLLAVPAGSEDALRAFYVGVLGMAEVAKPPALAARGGLGPWSRSVAPVPSGVTAVRRGGSGPTTSSCTSAWRPTSARRARRTPASG